MTDPIFARMVLAIEGRAHELGYDIVFMHTLNSTEREEACIRRLLSRRVDGMFLSPVYRIDPESRVYQELQSLHTPTVLLGPAARFCSSFLSVQVEDLLASYAATQHLIGLGHKRIAFLSGPQAAPWSHERFEGYRRALREAGMDVDDRLVFQAGTTVEDGAKTAMQILNESCEATAVQATSDLVAVGCADALLNQGIRIPEDMSVVGFGNILTSEYFRVPLTTIRQPKFRLGLAAVDAMLHLLRHQPAESKRLPAELIVRASTGPAKTK
jgi:DNA-binding LacI/PurR family transcriptional regulator